MKKILAVCFSVLTFLSLVLFTGCGASGTDGLQSGVKYYADTDATITAKNDADKCYFVFNNKGMGQYHYYYYYESYRYDYDTNTMNTIIEISEYTITFSYIYIDKDKEALVCTYESIEFSDRHNQEDEEPIGWSRLLTVSENVLMASNGTLYFSANYLAQHPNFYKQSD